MDDTGAVVVGMLLEVAQTELHVGEHLACRLQLLALHGLRKVAVAGMETVAQGIGSLQDGVVAPLVPLDAHEVLQRLGIRACIEGEVGRQELAGLVRRVGLQRKGKLPSCLLHPALLKQREGNQMMGAGSLVGRAVCVEPLRERRQEGIHRLALRVLRHRLCQTVAHLYGIGITGYRVLHLAEQVERILSVGTVLHRSLGVENLQRRLHMFAARG